MQLYSLKGSLAHSGQRPLLGVSGHSTRSARERPGLVDSGHCLPAVKLAGQRSSIGQSAGYNRGLRVRALAAGNARHWWEAVCRICVWICIKAAANIVPVLLSVHRLYGISLCPSELIASKCTGCRTKTFK